MCVYIYIYMYIYGGCVCVYICMYMYVYIYGCVYIYVALVQNNTLEYSYKDIVFDKLCEKMSAYTNIH